jgi:diphthamide synthase (EF-2-diphthine--ammonia ligase)
VESELRDRVRRAEEQADAATLTRKAAGLGAPSVAFLEWLDPVYVGGHWTPELIEMAGARHPLNPAGSGSDGMGGGKSFAVATTAVTASHPDFVILSPCGLDLKATEAEVWSLWETDESGGGGVCDGSRGNWFKNLKAVRDGRVAMVDGNQMFNRPGPRLVDALEWLVSFIHESPATEGAKAALTSFPWKRLDLSHGSRPAWLKPNPRARACKSGDGAPCVTSTYSGPVGGFTDDIEDCHRVAMERGDDMYKDPVTGYMVFTEDHHRKRGACCGRGCRHCPYGHWAVKISEHRRNLVKKPTLLPPLPARKNGDANTSAQALEVVFWSGGKDSYMALLQRQKFLKERGENALVVLLTTFDEGTGVVPEQEIQVTEIMDQARALDAHLLLVPLPTPCGSDAYLKTVDSALRGLCSDLGIPEEQRGGHVRLVFGDLHLADIRAWREVELSAKRGWALEFPLFGLEYSVLVDILWSSKATVRVSAVMGKGKGVVKVGQVFDQELVDALQKAGGIDAFGEHGEFHTIVSLEKHDEK